jgi:hypothetical protein
MHTSESEHIFQPNQCLINKANAAEVSSEHGETKLPCELLTNPKLKRTVTLCHPFSHLMHSLQKMD